MSILSHHIVFNDRKYTIKFGGKHFTGTMEQCVEIINDPKNAEYLVSGFELKSGEHK